MNKITRVKPAPTGRALVVEHEVELFLHGQSLGLIGMTTLEIREPDPAKALAIAKAVRGS